MDARFARSQVALREAVLRLAAARPVETLTVTELCREAGVTRDTFYRHGASPIELLADALAAELDVVVTPAESMLGQEGFRRAERDLLQHVARHAAVYLRSSQPTLAAPLRATLERVLRDGLLAYLRRFPTTLPAGVDADDTPALAMVAAYAASGTVGAIEAWLAAGDLDVDRGARLILAASPSFWMRSPAS